MSKRKPVEEKLDDIKNKFDQKWEIKEGFAEMKGEIRNGFGEMRERFNKIYNNLSLMVSLTLAKSEYIDDKYRPDFKK